jgi:hypothetical protein
MGGEADERGAERAVKRAGEWRQRGAVANAKNRKGEGNASGTPARA